MDPYRQLASESYGVPVEEVTEEMRTKMKQVAYGLIYGASNKTLTELAEINKCQQQ